MEPAVKPKRQGYTLLEVLIALLILVTIYPAVSTMVRGSRAAQIDGVRMEQASAYSRVVIDSLSMLPSGAWTSGSSVQNIAGVAYTATWTKPSGATPWLFPVVVSWTQGNLLHSISIQAVLL